MLESPRSLEERALKRAYSSVVEYLSPKEQTEVRILVGPHRQKSRTAPAFFAVREPESCFESSKNRRGRTISRSYREVKGKFLCDGKEIIRDCKMTDPKYRDVKQKSPFGDLLFLNFFERNSLSQLWIVLFEFNLVISKLLSVFAGIDQRARARAQFDEIVL